MEAQIIRTAIIIVDKVSHNSYGDLTWTDKEGNSYKIPAKRAVHFEKIIVPEAAVQLNYAMSSFGKEYIYSAVQVKDKLPPPQPIPPATARELPPKPSQVVPAATEPPKKPLVEAAKQLGGIEVKELTEREYWEHKNKTERKSIERQKALDLATTTAIEGAKIGVASYEIKEIIAIAKRFESYIESGE